MQDGTQLLLSQSQRKQPQVTTNQSKTQQQFGEELMSHKSAKELLSNRSDVAMQDGTQLLLMQRKQPQGTTNQSKTQQQFGEELMSCKSAKELLSKSKGCDAKCNSIVVASMKNETTRVHNKSIKTQQQYGEELMSHKSTKELLNC